MILGKLILGLQIIKKYTVLGKEKYEDMYIHNNKIMLCDFCLITDSEDIAVLKRLGFYEERNYWVFGT